MEIREEYEKMSGEKVFKDGTNGNSYYNEKYVKFLESLIKLYNLHDVIGCYYTIRYIDPYVRKERECTVRGDNEEHAKERFYQLYRGSFMIGISLDNNR